MPRNSEQKKLIDFCYVKWTNLGKQKDNATYQKNKATLSTSMSEEEEDNLLIIPFFEIVSITYKRKHWVFAVISMGGM